MKRAFLLVALLSVVCTALVGCHASGGVDVDKSSAQIGVGR
jgi:predicted small secreted protein